MRFFRPQDTRKSRGMPVGTRQRRRHS
jgi:hypothetical protein